jgi:hypothetical protein
MLWVDALDLTFLIPARPGQVFQVKTIPLSACQNMLSQRLTGKEPGASDYETYFAIPIK